MGLLAVLRIRSKSAEGPYSDCSPPFWNKLPADPRSITVVSKLKTNKPHYSLKPSRYNDECELVNFPVQSVICAIVDAKCASLAVTH